MDSNDVDQPLAMVNSTMQRRWLARGDAEWPASLDNLGAFDERCAVRHLWIEGQLPDEPRVAVVGARRATSAGLEIARRIGADLGRLGIAVVSGFARGIDASAHRGCLGAGGATLAVLGCGLDVDYPPQHRELRLEIASHGALVTEYELDDAPEGWRFPRRNRIIAALVKAVIVVEAGVTSGALSTARWATDLGRDVFAVPGSILGPANAGSNLLLRDGCHPFLGLDDLAISFPELSGHLPWPFGPSSGLGGEHRGTAHARDSHGPGSRIEDQTPSQRLLVALGPNAMPREVLARTLDLGPSELTVLLGELELIGAVRCLPGGLITRTSW